MPQPRSSIYPVISLFMVIFIDTMGFGIIFPVLSPLFLNVHGGMLPANTTLAMRDLLYGITLGVYALCMFFGAPILGDISDSLGRKKVMLFCLFGTTLTSLTCALGIYISSVLVLLLGRITAGLLSGSQPIAQAAMADISSGKEKTKRMGIIAFAGAVGFVFGPIFGGYFSDKSISPWFSYAMPFVLNGVLALLNGLLLLFSFKETYTDIKPLSINFAKGIQVFLDAFTEKQVRSLSTIFLLSETAFSLYFQFITLYLVATFSYTPSKLGLFMSYCGVLFSISLAIIMRIFLRFTGEMKIAFWGLVVTAIGYMLPAIIQTETMQWVAAIPIIVASGLSYNAFLAIFSNAVEKHQQGWVMGITSSIMGASWFVGAALTGLLFYFHPVLPFYVAAIFTAFSAAIFLYASRQLAQAFQEHP